MWNIIHYGKYVFGGLAAGAVVLLAVALAAACITYGVTGNTDIINTILSDRACAIWLGSVALSGLLWAGMAVADDLWGEW